MKRKDYANRFSDEEKLAYFEKKAHALAKSDYSKSRHYAVCAFNLRKKLERIEYEKQQ